MDKYISINLFLVKEGRPYCLSIPQMNQPYEELYAALEEFKVDIQDMEKKQKERIEELKAENKNKAEEVEVPTAE